MKEQQLYTNLLTGILGTALNDPDEQQQSYGIKNAILDSVPAIFGYNNQVYSPTSPVQQQDFLNQNRNKYLKQAYENLINSYRQGV